MASACEESSCWNLEWLQLVHFPLEYLIVILHAIFLFTLLPLCLSLSLFPPFFFSSTVISEKSQKQIRHFYNALLVGGRGAGRSRDWWERMIYVAAVSQLSSSPLSLIMAISFFRAALSAQRLRKAIVFSYHSPWKEVGAVEGYGQDLPVYSFLLSDWILPPCPFFHFFLYFFFPSPSWREQILFGCLLPACKHLSGDINTGQTIVIHIHWLAALVFTLPFLRWFLFFFFFFNAVDDWTYALKSEALARPEDLSMIYFKRGILKSWCSLSPG